MSKHSGFSCMECGKKFKTVAAAEKAQSNGCPKCGGCDVDLTPECPSTCTRPCCMEAHERHPGLRDAV